MYDVTDERSMYLNDLLNSKWEHTNEKGSVGKVVFSHLRQARNNSFSLAFFHYRLELVEKRHRLSPDELYLFVCRSSKYDMAGFSFSRSQWDYLLWTMIQAFYPPELLKNKKTTCWFDDFLEMDEPRIIAEDENDGGIPFIFFG